MVEKAHRLPLGEAMAAKALAAASLRSLTELRQQLHSGTAPHPPVHYPLPLSHNSQIQLFVIPGQSISLYNRHRSIAYRPSQYHRHCQDGMHTPRKASLIFECMIPNDVWLLKSPVSPLRPPQGAPHLHPLRDLRALRPRCARYSPLAPRPDLHTRHCIIKQARRAAIRTPARSPPRAMA